MKARSSRNISPNILQRKINKIGFVFTLPTIIFFILFVSIPVVFTVLLAFASWKGFDINQLSFIGLNNFSDVFTDRVFLKSFLNTVIFVALTTITLNFFGFIGALIIDQKVPGTRFLKNAIFLPVLLSPIIIGIMWSRMLDAFGIVNKIIQAIGLTKLPILFLGSSDFALYTIIIATLWQFTGYDMLLYYAGLQGIPNDLIEASRIDGANEFRVVTKIIIPTLSPVITITLLLNIIGGFKVFDIVYVMTAGGPNRASEVLATYLFQQAFRFNNMGFASVIALVIVSISLVVSIIRLRLTSRDL
ncbi:MAG: sugar ABC transporter permease [Actinobacteria bacterium]|nr:sugar ABC transporter permease [Actinomycetota bacterium]